MLHGQPGGARDWAGVVAALDGRARPIAIDRPGWDGHSRPSGLAGNGAAALAELDRRGIDRAVVAGHSLGGAVGIWLAVHKPERVSALVLAAPAANLASLQPLDRLLALPVVGPLASAASLTGLGLSLGVAPVRRRIATRAGLTDPYLRACGRALLRRSARVAFMTEQRSLEADLRALEDRLDDVRAPTWIVSGNRDRIVSPVASRVLARQIAGARLIALQRAGHLLPQLHADQLAAAILVALDESIAG
jgi:pimeloyl-ACP methyl ester carboxylesterase